MIRKFPKVFLQNTDEECPDDCPQPDKNERYQYFPDEPDDDELKDPLETLRKECSREPHGEQLAKRLLQCNDRVTNITTTETCVEELIDFMHYLDHCVGEKNLWSFLK